MSSTGYDVIIVGAGIVGSACARECAQRGMRVAVFDSEMVGGGATAAGMGHIVVMDDSEPQFALTRYSQQLWRDISSDLPSDVEFERCGTIWVAADDEEMVEVRRKESYYRQRGVPVEVLDSTMLYAAEPNLRQGLLGGLLVSEDCVLYPPCAARFLLDQAKVRGAEFHVASVSHIKRGEIRLADGSQFSAAAIMNATGAWAGVLTPGIDVKNRKGHLVITDRYPGFISHQLVELGYLKSAHTTTSDSVAFNVQPRRSGQVLIGSSRQYGADHKEVDSHIVAQMIQRAQEYMPGLAKLSAIRIWTGFRAATHDKLPIIGPCPEDSTIFLATGHEGLGITTSLATATLIADQLSRRTSAIPMEPYLPSRFLSEGAHV